MARIKITKPPIIGLAIDITRPANARRDINTMPLKLAN